MVDPLDKLIDTLEMQLPLALQKQSRWIFSDTDKKIPKDPKQLHYGITANITMQTLDHMIMLSQLRGINRQAKPESWQPAFRLNAKQDGWVMVDIEPNGMKIPDNPYLKLKFEYYEASMHGGLHGLIKIDDFRQFENEETPFYTKMVFKDKKFDTEVLMNRHFITFTGLAAPAEYTPPIDWQPEDKEKFFQRIQDNQSKVIEVLDGATIDNALTLLDDPMEPKADEIYTIATRHVNYLMEPNQPFLEGTDTSAEEYQRLNNIWRDLMKSKQRFNVRRLPLPARIQIAAKFAALAWPPRKKHFNEFNDSTHGDRVTYLVYVARKIVEQDQQGFDEWAAKNSKS